MCSNETPKSGWFRVARVCKGWLMGKIAGCFRAFFEVSVTVCCTFIPFIFISVKWSQTQGPNTLSSLGYTFCQYWQAGQIVLPIFGLCGAVAALLVLNNGYFPLWVHALVGAVLIIFNIGGGAALTGSDGFNKSLNPELVYIGFGGYAVLAVVWFLLVSWVRNREPQPRSSDQMAQSILKDVNARRKLAVS